MAIKKEKFRSGVIVTERITCNLKDSTPEELAEAIKMSLQNIGLEPVLKDFEKKAKEILIAGGHMTRAGSWRKNISLKKMATMSLKERDAQDVILRLQAVREHVEKNNAEWAAWNAVLMTNAAWRAEIRPFEGAMLFRGHLDMAGERGRDQTRRRKPEWQKWQAEADKIRKEKQLRRFTKKRLATKIKDHLKLNESIETIRKRIK